MLTEIFDAHWIDRSPIADIGHEYGHFHHTVRARTGVAQTGIDVVERNTELLHGAGRNVAAAVNSNGARHPDVIASANDMAVMAVGLRLPRNNMTLDHDDSSSYSLLFLTVLLLSCRSTGRTT